MPRTEVYTLAASEALNVAMASRIRMHIIPGAGATVTVSKIDSMNATAHDSDSSNTYTAEETFDVSWPFYRVSTASGSCRISTV